MSDPNTHHISASMHHAPATDAITTTLEETVPKATEAVTNVSKNLLAGAAARSMAATLIYPLDVVKTRLQFQNRNTTIMKYQYRNGWDAAKTILRTEGIFAFYKGLPIRLIYISPAASISFTIYENLKKSIARNEGISGGDIPAYYFILFGAVARVFGTACKTPLDLVKQNLQVENQVRDESGRRGFVHTVRHIFHQHGLKAFWSGYGVTLLRDVPFASIYFVSFEVLKRTVKAMTEDIIDTDTTLARDLRHLFCGSMSGLIATCFTIPVDVVKTRLQLQTKLGVKKYNGVVDAFSKIYREEGAKAFRKGLGPRLLSIIPSSGLTFALYEKLKTWEFFQSFAAPDPTLEETMDNEWQRRQQEQQVRSRHRPQQQI